MKFSSPIIFALLIISGCTSISGKNENLITHTATIQPLPSKTALPIKTPTRTPSRTSEPTETLTPISPTTSLATAVNVEATLETYNNLCAEFATDSYRYAEISPDEKWVSISCGYKRNQTLIVKNQDGIEWVFHFADFIDPSLEGAMGRFIPLAWSPDNRFLYFSKGMGYSGGGNQCFPGVGVMGFIAFIWKQELWSLLFLRTDATFPGMR